MLNIEFSLIDYCYGLMEFDEYHISTLVQYDSNRLEKANIQPRCKFFS